MDIESINANMGTNPVLKGQKESNSPGLSFENYLSEAINDVDALQKQSEAMNTKLVTGEVDNLHDVVIATEKADIALNMTLQIRNKLVEAYQEIMRMQI